MVREFTKYRRQKSGLEGIVIGDRKIVFPVSHRLKPNVATGLPRYFVIKAAPRVNKIAAGKVTRQFQEAMISSRTKCNRMTWGRCASSSK